VAEPRERIPEESWLLEAASGVVLADAPGVRELAQDPLRVRALAEWVERGGTLFVAGGTTPYWSGTSLEELLPVDTPGTRRQVSSEALAFLGELSGPATVSDATVRPECDLVAGTPSAVLVASRAIGRGRVVFLAFDPDAPTVRPSRELPRLARSLMGSSRGEPVPIPHERFTELSTRAFEELPPVGIFGLTGIALSVLAAAIVAGPIAARRRVRPALVLVAPALSALLAGAIVLGARLVRRPSETHAIAFVFPDGPRASAVIEDVALVAGDSTAFELDLAPGALPLLLERPRIELLDFRARRTTLTLAAGKPLTMGPIDALPEGLSIVHLGARVSLEDSFAPRVRLEKGELVLTASERPLPRGMALAIDRAKKTVSLVETPELAAHATARVRLDSAEELGASHEEPRGRVFGVSESDGERALLRRALVLLEPRIVPAHPIAQVPGATVWLAVPGPVPELVRVREQPRDGSLPPRETVRGRAFGVHLFAAEGS
jgi:hypothetical protein